MFCSITSSAAIGTARASRARFPLLVNDSLFLRRGLFTSLKGESPSFTLRAFRVSQACHDSIKLALRKLPRGLLGLSRSLPLFKSLREDLRPLGDFFLRGVPSPEVEEESESGALLITDTAFGFGLSTFHGRLLVRTRGSRVNVSIVAGLVRTLDTALVCERLGSRLAQRAPTIEVLV